MMRETRYLSGRDALSGQPPTCLSFGSVKDSEGSGILVIHPVNNRAIGGEQFRGDVFEPRTVSHIVSFRLFIRAFVNL
jgi:hypothetical protein